MGNRQGSNYGNTRVHKQDRIEGNINTSNGLHLIEVHNLLDIQHFHFSIAGYIVAMVIIGIVLWGCCKWRKGNQRQQREEDVERGDSYGMASWHSRRHRNAGLVDSVFDELERDTRAAEFRVERAPPPSVRFQKDAGTETYTPELDC